MIARSPCTVCIKSCPAHSLIISPSDTVPNSWCFAFLFKSPGSSLNIYSQVGLVTLGTLFTLFVIPSIYMLIARDHGKERDAGVEAKAA